MPCPTLQELISFREGGLAPDERGSVEHHVAACAECQAALAWHEQFASLAAADQSVDPPAWVTARAVRLFGESKRAAEERGVRGFVTRLLGALAFDSFAGGNDLVFARDGGATSRQLLYKTETFDVDLHVSSVSPSNQLRVTGQVLSTGTDSFEGVGGLMVEFEREGKVISSAVTSDFGEFTVEDVDPGRYDLRFVGSTREIVLPSAPMQLQ